MKAIAQTYKALGDETRLRIMALLLNRQELCVCDIMAALELPQSTISRHLSYLRNAGLVVDRRQGKWMYYKIKGEGVGEASLLFDLLSVTLLKSGQAAQDQSSLKKYLATKKTNSCV